MLQQWHGATMVSWCTFWYFCEAAMSPCSQCKEHKRVRQVLADDSHTTLHLPLGVIVTFVLLCLLLAGIATRTSLDQIKNKHQKRNEVLRQRRNRCVNLWFGFSVASVTTSNRENLILFPPKVKEEQKTKKVIVPNELLKNESGNASRPAWKREINRKLGRLICLI